jgi:hypothetical protein
VRHGLQDCGAPGEAEHGEAQRLRHRAALDAPEVLVHLLHERGGAPVVDAPQGHDGGGGARQQEAPRQAHHALGFDLPAPRVAGAQHDRGPLAQPHSLPLVCSLVAALHLEHREIRLRMVRVAFALGHSQHERVRVDVAVAG